MGLWPLSLRGSLVWEVDSSLSEDTVHEETWDGPWSTRIIFFLGEDLASLTRDLFSSTMWFYNWIGTRSLFVSMKNCANSWEPAGDQTHMDFALIELMMWRRPLNKW